MLATLDEAALQWGRTVETEVLGREDLVDEKKYTGRVAVPITRQQQLLVRRGQDRLRAAKPHSGIFWCFVSEAFAACLRGHPWPGVAASSATYVARSAACGGISLTTRPRCGAGGRVGARGWHYGRMQGCRWCSKSVCRRLVSLSAHRLAHGSGLRKTGRQKADGARLAHRWIKQWASWADASADANGLALQPQEQADLVAKEWHDLWSVGRACQIDFGVNNARRTISIS